MHVRKWHIWAVRKDKFMRSKLSKQRLVSSFVCQWATGFKTLVKVDCDCDPGVADFEDERVHWSAEETPDDILFRKGCLLEKVLRAMFPLSCARVCEHTGHETSAHKKTWSVMECSIQKCFCTYFIHVNPNSDEFRWNVAQNKFKCAHRL